MATNNKNNLRIALTTHNNTIEYVDLELNYYASKLIN